MGVGCFVAVMGRLTNTPVVVLWWLWEVDVGPHIERALSILLLYFLLYCVLIEKFLRGIKEPHTRIDPHRTGVVHCFAIWLRSEGMDIFLPNTEHCPVGDLYFCMKFDFPVFHIGILLIAPTILLSLLNITCILRLSCQIRYRMLS